MILSVSITPNASKNELIEWRGEILKIRIAAPPVDGKANKELLSFLAHALDLSPSQLTIRAGQTNKKKLVEIPLDKKSATELIARIIKKPKLL